MSEGDDWTLPPPDQKISRKELRRRHHDLIELARRAERGKANPRGGIGVVLVAAQYLGEELARRSQNRQTWWIIVMTAAITIMTGFIMAATLWPPETIRSAVHSLLICASQVFIDLWPWRG